MNLEGPTLISAQMPAILIDFFQSLKAQAMATFMSFPSHHT
jgi:hypothetical protein